MDKDERNELMVDVLYKAVFESWYIQPNIE